ncbi:MAG TPA: hypothetical protein VGL91_22885 [Acidobacteriota bacterium]
MRLQAISEPASSNHLACGKIQGGISALSRRSFLVDALLAATGCIFAGASGSQQTTKKLGAVVTIYSARSHARNIVDRFLMGYEMHGRRHMPNFNLIAMYCDQVSPDDLSRSRAQEFGFKIYPSIPQSLKAGTAKLAVDAVLLVGEHGDYPNNAMGQKLYPRYNFFSQIVGTFREVSRSVPVFSDKHLSVEWKEAKQMFDWSRDLKFPLAAGSSLPLTWRQPSLELPLEVEIEEALVAGAGSIESSWFHDLEALQCMVERRKGGETGVKAVHCIGGPAVWEAMQGKLWALELQEAAIARSQTTESRNLETMKRRTRDPHVMLLEYKDGLRATLVHLNDYLPDWNFAGRLKGGEIVSCTFRTPEDTANNFNCLVASIEKTFSTGKETVPVERTLLTTGILARLMESRYRGYQRLETPELDLSYKAPADSGFCKGTEAG